MATKLTSNLHFIEICLTGPLQIKWNNEINTLPVNLFEVHVKRWLHFARNLLNPRWEPRRGAHAAVLALTPTRALFFSSLLTASMEKGLKLSTPIISAGSFGLACDYTLNLQRLLPPARKVSDFFIYFWKYRSRIKPGWETAYVYKKQNNTEDCFW